MKTVIAISAHPDDETLGLGGTMLKHVNDGDKLYWINVTNVFENYGFSKERVESRQKEIELVAQSYGCSKTFLLDYPTMNLSTDKLPKLISDLSNIFLEINPEIVYCPNRSDAHSDHRIVFEAVMACTKSFRYPTIKTVLMYECISETEFAPALAENMFVPNFFVDITGFLDRKIEIMNIYGSEVGIHPFPRSIENIRALATFRGATAGVHHAEAFQLVRHIIK
jgi:LmbE family N-acetylglucosaminyl deacetylase